MRRRRYIKRPPIYGESIIRRRFLEGYTFVDHNVTDFPEHTIICQVGRERIIDLMSELFELSMLLRDPVDFFAGDEDSDFGFVRTRLTRYAGTFEQSREFSEIEPALWWSVFGKYFEDIYRDGFISISLAPMESDSSINSVITLTRDKELTVTVRNARDLCCFWDALEGMGLTYYRQLSLFSGYWRSYRGSEITDLLWQDLSNEINPKPSKFDRFGFNEDEGDAPMGI